MNIFFDLYGTLIDIHTNEKMSSIWEHIESYFSNNNVSVSNLYDKYFRRVSNVENSVNEFDVVEIFKDITGASYDLCLEASKILRADSIIHLKLYDGVKDLLAILKAKGHNIYLLSNAQKVFVNVELDLCGITEYFDKIFISSEYKIKKPSLDFFILALRETKSEISESMMIGNDYINDILPPSLIGMKTIFIETLLTPKHNGKPDMIGFNKDKILELIELL